MPIEVDENGDGVVADDKWSIFSRPKPYTPPFDAEVTITSQATEGSVVSTAYYTDKLSQKTRLYNDRPYRYDRFPKFMDGMTVVLTSNEDSAWPGEFDKSLKDNLFCTSTSENTPAVYVIIPYEIAVVPDWLDAYRVWDSQCYDDEAGGYCDAICDSSTPEWYGECPRESGLCYSDDDKCFNCFGRCHLFQCWYNS